MRESGGDLRRGLSLLWGTKERSAPGPKPGLSLAGIAKVAVEVADAEGLAALSMRRVAERLGVTTMALYRYVRGKAELLSVMLDAAIGEPPRLDDVAGGWRAKLAVWARETWRFFHRHPWSLRAVTDRRVMGPNEMAWLDCGLRALVGTGLAMDEMLRVVMLVNSYVRGAAQLALDQAQDDRRTGVGEDEWRAAYASLLGSVAADDRYATLAEVMASGAFPASNADEPEGGLEFGLACVLDGIEMLIRTRVAGGSPPS